MSFQQKLFKSNLKVAFIPIVTFLLIIVGLLTIYRQFFYYDLGNTDFEEDGTRQTIELMRETDSSQIFHADYDFDAYYLPYHTHGYYVGIVKDNAIYATNLPSRERDEYVTYAITNTRLLPNTPIVSTYSHNRLLILHKVEKQVDYYIIAVATSSQFFHIFQSKDLYFTILIVLLLVLLIFILKLCRNYSRRLIKQLMLPIVLLGDGAKRIQEGNLDVQLAYDSKDEFAPVFASFNEMQVRLKDSILDSIEREKSKQEMIAEISHDLKTPLTAIRGYVKGIEDGVANTPEKQAHYLEKIRVKTDDMNHLISKVLMYSRLERNKITFDTTTVQLDTYLTQTLTALQEDYEENTVAIIYRPGAPQATVTIDTLQFNRVLENIVENSRKYAGQIHTCITVTTKVKGDYAILRIQDNGAGVDEAKLPYIFDTFYRADDSRSQPTNGSGLGLSIAKHIVTQLSGTISAQNIHGLCITITLPLCKEDSDAENINH